MPPSGSGTASPDLAPRRRRLGAYVLAADPTWVSSSVARYYDLVDEIVVVAADDDIGWTGAPIRARRCVDAVRDLDTRGIVRVLWGRWTDTADPMRADTAQRQAALDTLQHLDWVLQIDTDELLRDPDALVAALDRAELLAIPAVEWPMQVLYRRRRDGSYLAVANADGRAHHEYPGPVAVRPGVKLVDARRTDGPFLRVLVTGDTGSTQVARPAEPGEVRYGGVHASSAILHNSWARSPRSVRAKVASWGHHAGWRGALYFLGCWLPAPLTWRLLRDFHPLFRPLWPRLHPVRLDLARLLRPEDLP